MADAWGGAWGATWLDTWAREAVEPPVAAPAPSGGIGHKRKRKRFVIDGRVYEFQSDDQARAFMRSRAAELAEEARIAEALGDAELAGVIAPKVVRITKRADKLDRLERLRREDEEILLQFILRVA